MTRLDLSSEFYAEFGDGDSYPQGEIFHFVRNARGGSLSVPVARFYVSRPRHQAEGSHEHTRLDCFVTDRKLVPEPDRLARLILTALTKNKAISEPIWLGWHHSREIGGQAHGNLFDYG